ncbi:MAG: CsgG/HfaB family protein [Elusimicrobiales bacterium]|nr:CsgG/HfaB family protein [Elusimicrobiales bacterium]
MKRMTPAFKLTLAAAAALLLCATSSQAAEDVYRKMANDFAKYSTNKKVKNVAVIGFSRKARTSREESDYISEKLLSGLVASGKVNLLERSQLDKVLEERRLSASGVTDEAPEGSPRRINPSDAIIVGTIFGTKEHLMIIAKMIDPLTGAVLHTVEAQTDRQWDILPERPEFQFDVPDLRELAAMFGEEEIKPAFVDFRDAPKSLNTETCNTRKALLAVRQMGAVEAKAKYWALQMRDPAFSASRLKRNPGGEMLDERGKQRFYALLDSFHRGGAVPVLSAGEMNTVIALMEEESRVSDECGLH